MVTFGDRPAAVLLEIGIGLCAAAGMTKYPTTAKKVVKDRFVDGATGGSKSEVDEMMGSKRADGTMSGTLQEILGIGGFKIKAMMRSGERDDEARDKLGDKVLGYPWDPEPDIMGVKFDVLEIQTGKKSFIKVNSKNLEDLDSLEPTRRMTLSVTMSIYDPMGILSPITIKFRLGLKKIIEQFRNIP